MTLALLSEMQVCKPLCRLHRHTWFDYGYHVPCKYMIGFGLPFFFFVQRQNSTTLKLFLIAFYDSP